MKMLNYGPEAIKSMYTVLNPNYAPSFNTIPNSDPVEANLEVSTFTEAKAVLDYIKNL
jgi:hypothetical protein